MDNSSVNNTSIGIRYFDTKYSTLHFVLLSIATAGFYFVYWIMAETRGLQRVAKNSDSKISDALILVTFGFWGWSGLFSPSYGDSYSDAETFLIISGLFIIVAWILFIVSSFRYRTLVLAFCKEQGLNIKMNPILTVILTFYYHYYVLRNAEYIARKNDIAQKASASFKDKETMSADKLQEELDKLKTLLDKGVISQEEYEAKRKNLLGL